MRRRNALQALAAPLLTAGPAAAQGDATLRLVVPYAAGGSQDQLARVLARPLALALDKTVVVENRPGAEAAIAVDHVARARADGLTLLLMPSPGISFAQGKLRLDPRQVLAPVCLLVYAEQALAVPSSLGVRSLSDLQQLARSRPAGLNCGSMPGVSNLACARLKDWLDGAVETIPFNGANAALTALAGGQVDLFFGSTAALLPHLNGGRIRVLAAAGDRPLQPPLHELPLIGARIPGLRFESYTGLFAPAGTPAALIDTLNRTVQQLLAQPELRSEVAAMGYAPGGGTPALLERTLQRQVEEFSATGPAAARPR